MKLQLLALVTSVATATALPALGATYLHKKRQVDRCTSETVGQACVVAAVCDDQTISCWLF